RDGREIRFVMETRRMRAAAVEELLLLANESEMPVVEQHDLDVDALLGGRGQFLEIHEQTAVAAEAHHRALWLCERRTDGCWQSKSHSALAARGQPLPGA